jgi:hypothetical protein
VKRAALVACAAALVSADSASAAIFIRLTATTVHSGGVLRVVGNAEAMPLYALPVARTPFCMQHSTCAGLMRRATPPRTPFILVGRAPGNSAGFATTRAFAVRLPRGLRPGRYKVFVWCEMCGGTLIPAGENISGQTLRVVP